MFFIDFMGCTAMVIHRSASVYFTRIVFVLVLVLLPFDTEVVRRIFPLAVVRAFVVILILFVCIFSPSLKIS